MPGTRARDEMVDAAERLIAERGLASVSLRDVQAAAGQRNKSAANYHFGSRQGLIDAIVEARMAPINDRRMAMLAELDAAGRGRDVRSLVEALVVPLAEATLGRPESSYARFLAQLLTDPSTAGRAGEHIRAESFRQACDRLMACLADVPMDLRRSRMDRVVAFAISSLAAWEGGLVREHTPARARVPDLVDSCVALVNAPVSAATRQALDEP